MRMLDSMLCIPQPVFLEKHGERPDLYGPFWISTTIVFLIAVVSNYIGWYNHGSKSGEATAAWKYDTDKVTYAGILFYGYVGAIGFAIWATLRWFKAPTSLAQIWCVYGTCIFTISSVIETCFCAPCRVRHGHLHPGVDPVRHPKRACQLAAGVHIHCCIWAVYPAQPATGGV